MSTEPTEMKSIQVPPQKIMSVNKFVLLSITTFGIYSFWWIYKEWLFFQKKDQLDIMPFMRTLFTFIFIYNLFSKIKNYAAENKYSHDFSTLGMFFGFLFFYFLSLLPDPYWLISVFSFVFLIPAFKALNHAKIHSTEFEVIAQNKYSAGHIIAMVFGIIFWILIILSLWFLSLETQ